MKIDILLSTYNGQDFIDEQIDSIFSQSYPHWKLLIRDDGSKDSTSLKLLQWKAGYPDKIELILDQPNVGVIGSFNALFSLSTAPYLAFCDQDDIWLPKKLQECLALLQSHERGALPLLVHSDLIVVDRLKKVIDPSFWHYSYLRGEEKYAAWNRLLVQNVVTGCTTLFNRPLAHLAFPVPLKAVMHDWWFALVASCFGELLSLKKPQILYRQHGNNTVGAKPFSILNRPQQNFHRLMQVAKHEKKKLEQSKAFLERFRLLLNRDQICLLEDLISLKQLSPLQRLRKIIRHRFFKVGWMRNLFYLISN